MELLKSNSNCPACKCDLTKTHSYYMVQEGDKRRILNCLICQQQFSEMRGSVLFGLKTPLSRIETILRALNEGMAINAVCRTFRVKQETLKRWLSRFSALKKALWLYSLCHDFLVSLVEGDELYTKIKKTFRPMKVKGGQLL